MPGQFPIRTMLLWDNQALSQNQTIEGPVIDLKNSLKLNRFTMFWAFGGAGTFRVEQTWAPTREGVFTDGAIIVVDKVGGGARVATTNRAVSAANVATLNTGAAHNLIAAEYALITGLRDIRYNGVFPIASAPSGTSLTYALTHPEEVQVADTEGRVVEIKSGSVGFTPITAGGFVKFRAREMNVGTIDTAFAWLCYQ